MRKSFALACLAMLSLAGCASNSIGPERDINDPTNSLVFAYVDMGDAPTELESASLKPQGEEGYWTMGVEDGLMSQQYLPPGSYQLASLSGSSFLHGAVVYNFPAYGRNEASVRIQKPGIYFLGSFKYKDVETGMFEAGKFDIERVKSPTELELLGRLLKQDWVKGTQWEARIRARMAELHK
ncbi:MAG TPA: hypothetical protein VF651_06740 [Gammaproteobacteria bacterium]